MALHKHVFYRRASPKVKAGWRAQVRRDGRRAHSPAFATQFDAALWAARELGCEMESLCLPVQRFRIRGKSSPWSLWLGGALPAPLVENDEPQGVSPRDSELPAPQVKTKTTKCSSPRQRVARAAGKRTHSTEPVGEPARGGLTASGAGGDEPVGEPARRGRGGLRGRAGEGKPPRHQQP